MNVLTKGISPELKSKSIFEAMLVLKSYFVASIDAAHTGPISIFNYYECHIFYNCKIHIISKLRTGKVSSLVFPILSSYQKVNYIQRPLIDRSTTITTTYSLIANQLLNCGLS